jgi:hypothetical protein
LLPPAVTRAARRRHAILYFEDSSHETGLANFQSFVLKERVFSTASCSWRFTLYFGIRSASTLSETSWHDSTIAIT